MVFRFLIWLNILILLPLFSGCSTPSKPGFVFTDEKGQPAASDLAVYISSDNLNAYNSVETYIFNELKSLYGYFKEGTVNQFDLKILPAFHGFSEKQLLKPTTEVKSFGPFNMFVSWVTYEIKLAYTIQIFDRSNKLLCKISGEKAITAQGEGSSPKGAPNLQASQRKSSLSDAKKDAITKASRTILIDISNSIINADEIRSYEYHLASEKKIENINQDLFVWSGAFNFEESAYNEEPFITINKKLQEKIDAYLEPRLPDDLSHTIPPKVEKPTLPPMPQLIKSQFETKEMFEERVNKALTDRSEAILHLQKKYRWQVEKRNSLVEIIGEKHQKQLEEIKKEQEDKKKILPEKIKEFTQISLFETMGKPVFDKPTYDAETETMHVELKASNAKYTKKTVMKVPLAKAESFYKRISDVIPVITFEIKNQSLSINEIKAHFDGEDFIAKLSSEDFQPEYLKVDLLDKKISFDDAIQKDLSLQNPNLIDTYHVTAVNYKESVSNENTAVDDDLVPLIARYGEKEVDPNMWLFIVAIENYNEADPVKYASNSAEKFKLVAQKVFGIDERRTYFLVDDAATSGAIKDRLTYLTENVKEGDSIIFYYSGHGVPDPKSQEAYLLPKDKVVDFVVRENDFQLSNIYKKLSDSKAGSIMAVIDACFSGKTDNRLIFKGIAPGLMRTKKIRFNENKMVVLTAGKDNQFSNSYEEKGHRMFSYFLMKSLLSRDKYDLDTIYKEVNINVKDKSWQKGDIYLQEPQLYGNVDIRL